MKSKKRIGSIHVFMKKIILAFALLFFTSVFSQIEVSVPFNDGFIGLRGNNAQDATNIQLFSTLTIAKAYFVQTTSSGRFEVQGNDITGTLRLQLNNGVKIDIPGALVWRENSGNTNVVLGFLANSSVSLNLSAYGGPNYSIQGGNATGKSNFGFKLNGVTYTLPNTGGSLNGNAANIDVALLNTYLDARPRVISPNPANFVLSTANQDPGDFVLANFGSNDILLASVGLVNPPTGASFSFGTTTGLTRSTGYTSWTGLTRISFTGTQANINAALASLSVATGTGAGDIKLSVSATVNEAGNFYNPINGHFYKPVSWPSTGRSGGASVYTQILADAAALTYKGSTGYLVTITSAAEDSFVSTNTTAQNVLIGLSDKDQEGVYKWSSGPESGTIIRNGSTNVPGKYNNWAGGEPNNWGSGENFVVTNWNGGTTWNDFGPPATLFPGSISSYIVEFGLWNDPDDNAFLDFYSASTTYVANCPSSQAPVAPTLVSAGTNSGAGTVPLVVSVASGTTVDWYASATGGTVLSGGQGVTSFTTPVISTTTTFYAQSRNTSSGCLNTTRTAVTATIVPCPNTAPNVRFKLSPPDVTTSAIQGQTGSRTENFNALSLGNLTATGTFAVGAFTRSNTGTVEVKADDVWGGSGSKYLQAANSGEVSINLTDASRYVGFWWAAGNANNNVTIYGSCGGNEIQLGTFTAQTVLNLLSGASVTAVNGTAYNSSLYKRSAAANEAFAYINLELDDPTIYFTRIVFGGSGFEFDNITTAVGYGAASATTPSAPTITTITNTGGTATINFTAPSSNGGSVITNYEYTTDGGTTWVAFSPVTTSSPITVSGLINGTTYPFQLRAINAIGSGAPSNTISTTLSSGLDSDGDTIPDTTDPDDDNDGLMDYQEQDCSASTSVSQTLNPSTFYFVQWNSFTNGVLRGVINVPGNPVNVSVTNTSNSILLQNDAPYGGISNWSPQPSGNPNSSTFRSNTLGEHKFVFDQPVNNPRFFINSLNKTLDLSLPGKVLNSNGFFTGAPTGTTTQVLVGNEGTGTISFAGNVFEISFTGRESEFYCNFSLGIAGLVDANACVDIDTDGDGTPNRLDLESDGDGVLDAAEKADGTDEKDSCKFVLAHQTAATSTAWNTADCDNDGVTNADELTDGTDPLKADTDGDGVIDGTEKTDGTDAKDGCKFVLAHQTVATSTDWNVADCDGDGTTNRQEILNNTDPLVGDTDGDGVLDPKEFTDGTSRTNSCDFILASQTIAPSSAWNVADCDADGVTNAQELTDGTNPLKSDTDGDGVIDGTEKTDGTDSKDGCKFVLAHQTVTTSAAWKAADCDADGVTNAQELTDGTDPLKSDTDGDGVIDGTEKTDGTDPLKSDTDGDGVIDGTEKTDGTDPKNGCKFVVANRTVTPSSAWNAADCDGDGLSNGTEGIVDTDRDGTPDYLDLDSDGDGILDRNDAFPKNPLEWTDTDRDGIGNNADTDDDNDGILDACDVDTNGDGIPDNGSDMDADGINDGCDTDKDGDGVNNISDNCPNSPNTDQADRDRDGKGDICDTVEINVSQAISPNGDGVNDTWVIYNLSNYPGTIVRVFNRWGKEVFYSNDYQNNWTGHYKDNSEKLPPSGSYFYQIDLKGDGSIDAQGWLYITQ